MRKHYIAAVHKDDVNGFSVAFPDFPGAVTAAPTLDEAIKRAGEVLAIHVEGIFARGGVLPTPSGVSPILANPDYRTDVLALVPLQCGRHHMSTRPKPPPYPKPPRPSAEPPRPQPGL
jgi:predicted RNase H-like HicB family nuclease